MLFFTFCNANIRFAEKELIWRCYTIKEVLLTTQRIELIDKKEFAKVVLDKNIKAFVVHVSVLSLGSKMTIHSAWKAQIALLLAKKVTVPVKYADFSDVFLKKSAKMLLGCIGVIEHANELENDKQPSYGPICSLDLVKLEIRKIYIKINLSNGFIWSLKSPAGTPILFVCKLNGSFQLCINYRGLNNLTIKNRYPLSLIGESLDWWE